MSDDDEQIADWLLRRADGRDRWEEDPALVDLRHLADEVAALDPVLFDEQTSLVEPPADLRGRILGEVGGGSVAEPAADGRDGPSVAAVVPLRRRRWAVWGLAAAAAVIVVVVAFGIVGGNDDGAEFARFELQQQDGFEPAFEFRIEDRDGLAEIVIVGQGLDPALTYDVWLRDADDERIKVGSFDGTDTDNVELRASISRDEARRIWITDPDDTTVLAADVL